MANIYPSLYLKHVKMTPGEREFSARLLKNLEDDYTVWFDIPIGRKQLRPDFVILDAADNVVHVYFAIVQAQVYDTTHISVGRKA